MIKYIIATHGTLSEGFLNALELFLGDGYEIHTISAYIDEISLEDKFNDIISKFNKNDEVIVFTDINGGSVNQFFTKRLLASHNLHVITGVNLGLIIELILCLGSTVNTQIIETAITQAREQILYMNETISLLMKCV